MLHAALRSEETNKLDVIILAAGALLRADFFFAQGCTDSTLAATVDIQAACINTATGSPG